MLRPGLVTALLLSVPAAAHAEPVKWVDWQGLSNTAAIGLFQVCDGSVRVSCDGSVMPADGSVVPTDGSVQVLVPGAGPVLPSDPLIPGDGSVVPGDGSVVPGDGSVLVGLDGVALPGDGSVKPGDGSVVVAFSGGPDATINAERGEPIYLKVTLTDVLVSSYQATISFGATLANPYVLLDAESGFFQFNFDSVSGTNLRGVRIFDIADSDFGITDPDLLSSAVVYQLLGAFDTIGLTVSREPGVEAPITFGFTVGIDANAFIPVPAPATAAVLLAGLALLGATAGTRRIAAG